MRWRMRQPEDNDSKLDQALEAQEEAQSSLTDVQGKVRQSKETENRLREIRRRNHFRELFEEALK